jgi:hypothetical protein
VFVCLCFPVDKKKIDRMEREDEKKPTKLVKRSTDGRSVFFESVEGLAYLGRDNEVVRKIERKKKEKNVFGKVGLYWRLVIMPLMCRLPTKSAFVCFVLLSQKLRNFFCLCQLTLRNRSPLCLRPTTTCSCSTTRSILFVPPRKKKRLTTRAKNKLKCLNAGDKRSERTTNEIELRKIAEKRDVFCFA